MILNIDSTATLVFDLDDTLYKEIDYLKSAYQEIAKHVNNKNWHATYALMFALYREKKNVFEYLSDKFEINKEELLTLYRGHFPDISLQSDTELLFDQIKATGAKITLLTDGRSITQRNKIKALGLEKWIDNFFISEELGSEKPAEKNYIAVENYFKTRTYFYIADNLKKDFIIPNQRGWKTIGLIDNGLNIHVDSASYAHYDNRPQHFVLHLGELLDKQINGRA
ncbi:MAG TPA: HAD family hydrolase [Leeuwenhoekiella sp.]|nr:HAD family hydrolase [Leeuwenhoekiella sp.]